MLRHVVSKTLLAMALATLMAAPAWSSVANRRVEETAHFTRTIVVNGTRVPTGEYLLVARGDRLKVETTRHHVMAESPITWKHEKLPSIRKLDVDRGVLTKVNIRGTREAVLLHNS